MDSANSTAGSMQSSSGADDEYDSRADSSMPAFFTNNPSSSLFDPPSSIYFDPTQSSPSLSGLDMAWSKPSGSEPNPADLGRFDPPFLTQTADDAYHAPESASRGLLSVSASNKQAQTHNNHNGNGSSGVRNPKKRARASRRAPTTVLTTDTTNFRAMVQEFTGIPAPPFASSPFQRTRLDLFGSSQASSNYSSMRSQTLPPYNNFPRPFAQKPQPYHPLFSSSSSVSVMPFPTSTDSLASNNSATTNSNSVTYQMPSDLGFLKQHLNANRMHNPILNFNPALQHPPLGNSNSILASFKPQGSMEISQDSHLRMGVLEEFGLNHARVDANSTVTGPQNMVSSSSDWAGRTGSGNFGNSERFRNGGKAASSNFQGEKGPARSEGMIYDGIVD